MPGAFAADLGGDFAMTGKQRSAMDRDLACEEFLEAGYDGLVASARAEGWSDDEIANAMLSLAQQRVQTARADAWIVGEPRQGGPRN